MYCHQLHFITDYCYTDNDVVDEVVNERIEEAVLDPSGQPVVDEQTGHQLFAVRETPKTVAREKVGKEGVRSTLPHPSRSYIDINWPAWTLNHDCGVEFGGYWRVSTYGTIRKNSGYWNTDRIGRSSMFSDARWSAYFQSVGNTRMSIPYSTNWFSSADRERQIDRQTFFSSSEDDQPVWVTEHFEKINPRRDFEDPSLPDAEIWFRIVLASDNVPIYVTALPERPANVWLYEPNGSRSVQSSILMELMPYGDHGTNLLTQAIISAEQNLANLTLFDSDMLDPKEMKEIIENPNKRLYRKLQIKGFPGKKLFHAGKTADALFKSFRFPQLDISGHLTLLQQLISLMQRASGMSEQEVGSTASHEQSAEEIRAIHTATGHRAEYVAAWMDFTFEAWKRSLWVYYTQFGTLDAVALLDAENQQRALASGFTFEQTSDGKILVRAPMNKLRCEQFVAQRDGPNRIPWATIGGQMLTFLNNIMASPLSKSLPPSELAKLVNEGLECLQFPRSFRLTLPQVPENAIPEVLTQYIQQQLGELANQVKMFVAQQTKEAIAEYEQSRAE